MNQSNLQARENSLVQLATEKASRLFFIDHLRTVLVILVVLHHLAVVYGEGISFYYVEPPNRDSLTYLVLVVFVLLNQAWFMGAFFLLAGYFTPGSYDRKGLGSFLKDRLSRLGLPLIIFYFVLNPISATGLFLEPNPRITEPLTWQSYWQLYPDLMGIGPLWFVTMLLIFSFGYASWRMLTQSQAPSLASQSSLPSYLGIGLFILALALGSYLIRIIIPLGQFVLGFPTLAYFPQYLSFFILGIVASRHNWFRTLPNSMGLVGFVTALVAFVLLFPLAFFSNPPLFLGNGYWQSAVYVLWDSIFAVGLCLGLIVLFRHFFNGESKFGTFLSQHSYTVYIIHSPIIVFLAFALRDVDLENMLKFGLMTFIVIPICFAIAYIIRKIPFASRVL